MDYSLVKPKIVIQSRLSPDTSFQVQLSMTKSPIDDGHYTLPPDAKVSIVSLSSGSVTELYLENGLFVAPQKKPVPGESYSIYVNAPGYFVEATTSIPQPVELDVELSRIYNLRMVESELTAEKMNVTYDLFLAFKTHNHQYFHFSFLQTSSINVGTASEPEIVNIAYLINPQYPGEDGFYEHHETRNGVKNGVLIDAAKTESYQGITFSFVDYTLGDTEELGKLYIEVKTVSEEYYLYHTSLSRQLISRQDPFAEPIPVFNNVQGGSGNFSGFSRLLYEVAVIP